SSPPSSHLHSFPTRRSSDLINSYRIFYQSDKALPPVGVNLNIFGSTIFDINAPSLLKYSIENNEIVHVARDSSPDSGERQFSARSEEHTSELQSLAYLVCRL